VVLATLGDFVGAVSECDVCLPLPLPVFAYMFPGRFAPWNRTLCCRGDGRNQPFLSLALPSFLFSYLLPDCFKGVNRPAGARKGEYATEANGQGSSRKGDSRPPRETQFLRQTHHPVSCFFFSCRVMPTRKQPSWISISPSLTFRTESPTWPWRTMLRHSAVSTMPFW